jgi:hypothetical protein
MNPELELLATRADALGAQAEAETQAELNPAPDAPAVDPVADIRAILELVVTLVSPLYPWFPRIYNPEALDKLAAAVADVFAKYNWKVAEIVTRFGPELNLAVVAFPLVMETAKAIRAERVKSPDAPEKEVNAAPPAVAPSPWKQTAEPFVDHDKIAAEAQLAADRAILG